MTSNEASSDYTNSIKLFVCGGFAGCCAKTTVAPLDRMKILLQAHNKAFESTNGIARSLADVWHNEGLLGFYRGNGAQMVRIFPYSAIQFFAFDRFSSLLHKHFGNSHSLQLVSGSLAGVTALSCTYPLDIVRSRLAFQRKGNIIYNGIIDCLQKMRAEGKGVRAFYTGFLPSLYGMIPYAGISFYTFSTLKRQALHLCPDWLAVTDADGKQRLRTGARLLIGGLSGALAQTVSYPLDSTRRTMQVAIMRTESAAATAAGNPTMMSTLIKLYTKYGIVRGLYRGLSINYFRVIPMAAVSFTTFESLKQMAGVK